VCQAVADKRKVQAGINTRAPSATAPTPRIIPLEALRASRLMFMLVNINYPKIFGKLRPFTKKQITNALTAGYLNRSTGTLRNQLSKAKLKFPDLKKEALISVTD
jgi:hypothetical protein